MRGRVSAAVPLPQVSKDHLPEEQRQWRGQRQQQQLSFSEKECCLVWPEFRPIRKWGGATLHGCRNQPSPWSSLPRPLCTLLLIGKRMTSPLHSDCPSQYIYYNAPRCLFLLLINPSSHKPRPLFPLPSRTKSAYQSRALQCFHARWGTSYKITGPAHQRDSLHHAFLRRSLQKIRT